ncbi:hypothetical protein BDQ17DRAFT_1362845 [Cyathus striatus]|nr:hypothetical protein BDQ17DRAFT_1362845 [Cyathus striatus]
METQINTLLSSGGEHIVVTTRVQKISILRFFQRAPKDHATSHGMHSPRQVKESKNDRKAKKSALIIRSVIVGSGNSVVAVTPAATRSHMSKVKSQLGQPSSAKRVIDQLRCLPASDSGESSLQISHPIHAVCLEHTEAEADNIHFSKLSYDGPTINQLGFPAIISAPIDNLATLFTEMHVVDLISTPMLGLGQPGDGDGILAGSVPTAETVIEGIKQITPELMALGYATGKAIIPDHTGVYPPTDRMSVLTYWWGLELVLPAPTIVYLDNAQSISNAVVNFLSALALINNGVREILPFIRYIAQFVEFEFNTIRKQDKGQGVVCAATWIMPAAMVPRPWDFAPPPPTKGSTEKILPETPIPKSTPPIADSLLGMVTTETSS